MADFDALVSATAQDKPAEKSDPFDTLVKATGSRAVGSTTNFDALNLSI